MATKTREIVVPGDLLDDTGDLKPGANTYRQGNAVYATRLGVKSVRGKEVSVISLSGRYEPRRGDLVIGTCVEMGPSNWYVNVGAAQDAGMHVNDVPWRVEFGETAKYLAVGETVLLKVAHVDEMKKMQVTMKDRQARKLAGGLIVEVAPTKVPRIIGRGGSMITMIKDMTNVRMFVGQNGVIWIDGEPQDVALALDAVRYVEANAHTSGLTTQVKNLLEERTGKSYDELRRELAERDEETFEPSTGGEVESPDFEGEVPAPDEAEEKPRRPSPKSPDEEEDDEEEDEDDEDDDDDDDNGSGSRGRSGGRARRGRGRRGGRGRRSKE